MCGRDSLVTRITSTGVSSSECMNYYLLSNMAPFYLKINRFSHHHQFNAVVFAIISTIKQAKLYLSSTSSCRITLLVHVIYSSAGKKSN